MEATASFGLTVDQILFHKLSEIGCTKSLWDKVAAVMSLIAFKEPVKLLNLMISFAVK
jgi:hypothetical protein